MIASEAVQHSIHAIQAAKILHDPYKHLVIDGIFPGEYYLQMLAMFPRQDLMPKSRPDVHQIDLALDPGVERFADGNLMIDNTLKKTEPDKYDFWVEFRDAYFSSSFCMAIMGRFADDLDDRDLSDFYPVGRLAIDMKGAGLGPHRDRDDKICSVLFYLGESFDASIAEPFGTLALRSTRADVRGSRHFDYDGFEVAKVISYLPNRMVCWAVTRGDKPSESFHAYHQSIDKPRHLIKFFVQRRDDIETVRETIASTRNHADDWRRNVSESDSLDGREESAR